MYKPRSGIPRHSAVSKLGRSVRGRALVAARIRSRARTGRGLLESAGEHVACRYRGAARRVAKQRLEHASGEPVDLTPYPITVEWIRDFSGDPSADFVDPGSVEVRFDGGHINALQVIRLSGLYLVREDTSQPDWWIGAESEPGRLLCWAVYGNLYDAIESR